MLVSLTAHAVAGIGGSAITNPWEGTMSTTATIENMRRHYRAGVFAYSPYTGEEYSANPADYFWAGQGFTLTDAEDEPMILVTRSTTLVDADRGTTTDSGDES